MAIAQFTILTLWCMTNVYVLQFDIITSKGSRFSWLAWPHYPLLVDPVTTPSGR